MVATAVALGKPFELNRANNEFHRQVAQLSAEWNRSRDEPGCAAVPAWVKARIRTAVAQTLFAEQHGREAANAQNCPGSSQHAPGSVLARLPASI